MQLKWNIRWHLCFDHWLWNSRFEAVILMIFLLITLSMINHKIVLKKVQQKFTISYWSWTSYYLMTQQHVQLSGMLGCAYISSIGDFLVRKSQFGQQWSWACFFNLLTYQWCPIFRHAWVCQHPQFYLLVFFFCFIWKLLTKTLRTHIYNY